MINDLRLQQFRSYEDASFEFDNGVTIIVGANASGKTNLLEAVLVLAHGHSYRVVDESLVMFDKPWARLDATIDATEVRTLKLEQDGDGLHKQYIIGDKPFSRLSLPHQLPTVVFEPNHLMLLNGSPETRRNYLDDLLVQLRPGFSSMRSHYKRALSQRNALLKKGPRIAAQQIFAWNLRLSELGGHIAEARMQLIEDINKDLDKLYGSIAHSPTHVAASYTTSLPPQSYATALLHKLEGSLELDCERGFTAYGPHRDDMTVTFDGHPAALSASRGETRTALLALKLVELKLLEAKTERSPLLLLDDVFSELDGARRKALVSYLEPYQTLITTTDADVVLQHFSVGVHIIAIGNEAG